MNALSMIGGDFKSKWKYALTDRIAGEVLTLEYWKR